MNDSLIPPDVYTFLYKAADWHGRSEAEKFSQEMFCQIHDRSVKSPIEQLVWIALNAQCAAADEAINPEPFQDDQGSWLPTPGVYVRPQYQIGRFRVDFFIARVLLPREAAREVVVELDGHAFHDKDKHQRSYEKARDRFLVKSGYRVLHYTGSDVVKDPFRVSHEILSFLGVFGDGDPYHPDCPLGIEL